MSEKNQLPPGRIFSISAGHNTSAWDMWEEEARGFDQNMVKRTFPTANG